MSENAGGQIESVMKETRLFPPSQEFASRSRIGSMAAYEELYEQARQDPQAFWGDLARQELHWFEDFHTVLEWDEPFASWFVGGKTNASYNCLDAHLATDRADQTAIIWEGEPVGEVRTLTYRELHSEVCRFANVLKGLGIGLGDVVSIYMPMVPELAIAMLACARVGAIHSVIFAGFSALSIADRNNDAQAKLQLTADGAW
jgi:acetyl-CoA synthetase